MRGSLGNTGEARGQGRGYILGNPTRISCEKPHLLTPSSGCCCPAPDLLLWVVVGFVQVEDALASSIPLVPQALSEHLMGVSLVEDELYT